MDRWQVLAGCDYSKSIRAQRFATPELDVHGCRVVFDVVGRPNIGYIVVNDCWVFEEGHELGFVVDSENFLIKRHFDHRDVQGAGSDLHQPYAHDITGVEAFICVGRLPERGVSERGVVDQCDVVGRMKPSCSGTTMAVLERVGTGNTGTWATVDS